MKTAKVITIEIQEVPSSFVGPYYERAKPTLQRLNFLDDMAAIPLSMETMTRDTYPMVRFAYGSQYDIYYVRDKDKEAFEELVKDYINKAKVDVIDQIIAEFERGNTNVFNFLENLKVILKKNLNEPT